GGRVPGGRPAVRAGAVRAARGADGPAATGAELRHGHDGTPRPALFAVGRAGIPGGVAPADGGTGVVVRGSRRAVRRRGGTGGAPAARPGTEVCRARPAGPAARPPAGPLPRPAPVRRRRAGGAPAPHTPAG